MNRRILLNVIILQEPPVSIPISNSDNPPASSDPEIIKIRVPIVNSSNSEVAHISSTFEQSEDDISSPKSEAEIASPKIPYNLKTATTAGVKQINIISKVSQNASSTNGEVKPQIYDSDIKISFVSCSLSSFFMCLLGFFFTAITRRILFE